MGQLSFDIHLSLVVEFPPFLYRNQHKFLCHSQIVHTIDFFYYRWKIYTRHIHHYRIAGRCFLLCPQYIIYIRTVSLLKSRRLVGSTNQAFSNDFYFRIAWKSKKLHCFLQNYSLDSHFCRASEASKIDCFKNEKFGPKILIPR